MTIRVAYVAGEPNPSRVPHLAELARAEELDLTVIYAAPSVHRRTWRLDPGDATVLRGPVLPAVRLLHHDYPLTPQIWPLLERGRFDCVIVGGWSLLATQLAIAWCRVRGVPYLLISENHLREPRRPWIKAVKSVVLRHVIPHAAGHLVTGRLAAEHQLHYGARRDRIVIWPNTVDVSGVARRVDELRGEREQLRANLGAAAGDVVVLHVGRLIREKGPDETLEAVARARALTEVPLRLVVVGDGPLDARLRARARELGLTATFTGLLQGDELLRAYAAADVFALLSRRETWGIVVNEAAAAGLPLVLTDRVGAAADLLEDGENGVLVPSGDRERLGGRSRELVAPYTYEGSVRDLVELVRAVV